MMISPLARLAWVGLLSAYSWGAAASDLDEFKVKRQELFEFEQKPSVKRSGDYVEISFESKAYCDVTVAVENADGKILRHLASGVLGPNAPAPFQKDALKQTIVWDGKDDREKYLEDKETLTIRVSLGLKPQFERTLYWEPKKRWSASHLLVQPAPEGIYVLDNGNGVAQLRLFDHQANYLKTLYPFPADKLDQVQGLNYHRFPQLEKPQPLRRGFVQATLLSSGSNAEVNDQGLGVGTAIKTRGPSYAASTLAVHGDRIALMNLKLNRLSTDGSSGGLPLDGPEVSRMGPSSGKNETLLVGPTSAAFSPDGRRLYLAGYSWTGRPDCLSGVAVMDYRGTEKPTTFVGALEPEKRGVREGEFNCATSVAVDQLGRVYVSDYMNNRVQVFSPEGAFLKALPVHRPALVNIHPKTQEVYVFSWAFWTVELDKLAAENERKHAPMWEDLPCKLIKFGPFEKPQRLAEYTLPLPAIRATGVAKDGLVGVQYWGAVDGYGPQTVIWLSQGRFSRGMGYVDKFDGHDWSNFGVQVLVEEGEKLTPFRDFGKETQASVQRTKPGRSGTNQMLYVNPANGKLYLWEGDSGCIYKNCQELLEIDPESGAIRKLTLPFSAMDLSFDIQGQLYMRTTDVVARFTGDGTREIPWDYGQEIDSLSGGTGGFDGSSSKRSKVMSGLLFPAQGVVCYMQSGMGVSPLGDLAVAGGNRAGTVPDGLKTGYDQPMSYAKPYTPRLYPGRQTTSTSCSVHVYDAHGKLKHEDAIAGLPQLDGVQIDRHGNLYVMACPSRNLDGQNYFNPMTSTLIKFKPKSGKIYSTSDHCPIPLSKEAQPEGAPHIGGGNKTWVQGAEWFYGGLSWAGFNGGPGGGCQCWSWARFTLDLYARSIAPEPDLYSFAVLDTNGNLILRIGRYGNVDDGKPLVAAGGPSQTRSIGGDEVGLFCAKFVATHTDKRVFIADAGNHRLLSVKLGYHEEARVALKDVPNSTTSGR